MVGGHIFFYVWSFVVAAMSDYLETKVLDYVLRDTADWAPSAIFLSLHTDTPGDGDGNEVSAGAYTYARQAITFNAAHATAGTATNSSVEEFTNMPAAAVTHIGLHDAVSAGNLLFHGALTAAKTVANGDTIKVAADAITVTLA
jgi:hypothetical protein